MVGMWFFDILSKRNSFVNFFLQDFGISFQDLLGRSNKKIELTLRKLVIFENIYFVGKIFVKYRITN